MTKAQFINGVTRTFHKVGFQLKKHSPEILVGVGLVGVVASAVLACKASTKLPAVLEDTKDKVEFIKNAPNNPELKEEYTEEDSKKALAITYTKTGLELVKMYAPAVTLGAVSIGCIIASHNIKHQRNLALAAAYATVDQGFKDYRNRVIERFGEELDKELKFNIKKQEVEEQVVDEKTGEVSTVKKTIDVVDPDSYSPYAKCYDVGCTGWTKDPEHNLFFLRQQQNYANDLLKAQGYLFLNDVYEMLGIPKTQAGQIVGWIYDKEHPNGDNFVDFGIYDIHKPSNRDFVNGYERTIWLDFNVDGDIWSLMS